jgi:hypothetical protein
MNNTLDLHGTKHADVFMKVDKFIGDHIQKRTRQVEIITGFSKDMKKLVNEVLSDYGASSQDAFMNAGKIIIDLT